METSIHQGSAGTPRGGMTREESVNDICEAVRVAVLSCTNGTNDAVITGGLANIDRYSVAANNNPDNVVTESLNRMSVEQLTTLCNIAAMENTPTTTAAFAKCVFSTDFQNLTSKTNELGYMKAAQIAVAEKALVSQYYQVSKLDVPKFRNDVQSALTRVAGNVGYQQGAAAAKAAPAAR
jgi:hypothetical protein